MEVYRIKNWEQFERSDTRKCVQMRWVPIPNSFDSNSFRRMVMQEKAAEIWTAWLSIILVASKMPNRGVLFEEDKPLKEEDLAFITGFSEEIFKMAIPILLKLGLLEKDENYKPKTPSR